jgi:RHS repeat-associated protein
VKHPLASLFVILFLVSVPVSGGELRIATEDVQPPPWAGQYRYDGAGNIKAIGTNQYVYDGAGRLITATMTAGVKAYTYDEFGNLVRVVSNGDSAHVTVAGVDRATNQIDDATACTPGTACIIFSFDTAGNQITGPAGAQYQYDPLNMMTELSGDARHDIYIYDADDQRIATVNDGGATSRIWRYTLRDGGANVIREWDDSVSGTTHTWTWTKDYVHRGTSLLATLTPSETSEIRTHFHLDHLGTPRLLTDDLGRKVSIHTYWPFGEETPDSDHDAEARKFTGHERDFAGLGNVNDLDYMHARFYGPAMGRFLSVDPTWDSADLDAPQSWNRYAYTENNPINKADPDGKCPNCLIGAGVGALIGGSFELGAQLIAGENVNWRRVTGAAVGGAITGAVAGLTLGSSLVVSAAAGGAANVIAGAAERGIDGDKVLDKGAIVKDAIYGVVGGAAGAKAGGSSAARVENSAAQKVEVRIAASRVRAAAGRSAQRQAPKAAALAAIKRRPLLAKVAANVLVTATQTAVVRAEEVNKKREDQH